MVGEERAVFFCFRLRVNMWFSDQKGFLFLLVLGKLCYFIVALPVPSI